MQNYTICVKKSDDCLINHTLYGIKVCRYLPSALRLTASALVMFLLFITFAPTTLVFPSAAIRPRGLPRRSAMGESIDDNFTTR